ncbi:Golgi apparatus membrane protein TVP23 homolog A [Parasteatoda tepidariorum]|uniref:Golgi apparatus membrane protein TVP23 homolog A n=1 Tax=Parasteatoda tepidariorum TaxID=114398 RepID=UPI00077F9D72|nr:Golgi apparatus membrane protein TVP23 homolog A [Parasteatoda tepidariorum]XP_015908262.1 Golgi apparatus membrane protein TVP23 homolog A [Parasteatoda tepidariorum]XP_015908263.1 Golgi apparatus membrane protein TVP23 homolog A [Parasteatoda tepidariorum]XP_015908264.1 Golgi apparatus membrane protein TVP23 homolog A [Parasteatoda tepidariorum]
MMRNPDDVALHFSDDANALTRKHPLAVLFHLAFRSLALITYLLCGWFSNSFISSFVSIVLFLSLDFWTVKNITGRLLVGLRWWNYVDDEGKSHWVFESRKAEEASLTDAAEAQVFWLGLIICPVIWTILLFISFFRLNVKWFVVVIVALVLNGANLYGYLRCRVGGNESFGTVVSNMMGRQVISNMFNSFRKKPEQAAPPNRGFTNTV